ncbi:GLT25D [Mytilus edulis]|uniref:GLT25D n=1 Tax=Mytilus edulis TaxID=6550 RepID=A0A8S3SN52_MYTED|nr:GLT25D [Mytilus edulis]
MFFDTIVWALRTNTKEWPAESRHMYKPDTLGFDKIYILNLERRPERRERIEKILAELKLDYSIFSAVDGRKLNPERLAELGVTILPGYEDMSLKRNMTYGEVGCTLSHYFIWKDMIANNYNKIWIIEDDASFFPMFRKQFSRAFADIEEFVPNWDLMFLARKPMEKEPESFVEGAKYAKWPGFSYWGLSYAITRGGVDKIMRQNPLRKLAPIDELLPIMYNRHPMPEWKKLFKKRDLIAVSIHPLLIVPSWWFGETECISDSEVSETVSPETKECS